MGSVAQRGSAVADLTVLLLRPPKQKSPITVLLLGIALLSQVLIGQETVSLIDVNQTFEPIATKLLLGGGGEVQTVPIQQKCLFLAVAHLNKFKIEKFNR